MTISGSIMLMLLYAPLAVSGGLLSGLCEASSSHVHDLAPAIALVHAPSACLLEDRQNRKLNQFKPAGPATESIQTSRDGD